MVKTPVLWRWCAFVSIDSVFYQTFLWCDWEVLEFSLSVFPNSCNLHWYICNNVQHWRCENWAHVLRKPVLRHMQTTNPRSLISAFVVRCQYSRPIILILACLIQIARLYLASVAKQSGLSLTWSQTSDDRLSRDLAYRKNRIIDLAQVREKICIRLIGK